MVTFALSGLAHTEYWEYVCVKHLCSQRSHAFLAISLVKCAAWAQHQKVADPTAQNSYAFAKILGLFLLALQTAPVWKTQRILERVLKSKFHSTDATGTLNNPESSQIQNNSKFILLYLQFLLSLLMDFWTLNSFRRSGETEITSSSLHCSAFSKSDLGMEKKTLISSANKSLPHMRTIWP